VEREAQEAALRQQRRDRPARRGPRSGSTGTTAGGTEAGRSQVDGDVVLPTAEHAIADQPVARSADVAETPAVPLAEVSTEAGGDTGTDPSRAGADHTQPAVVESEQGQTGAPGSEEITSQQVDAQRDAAAGTDSGTDSGTDTDTEG
jgi:small subunit ribosomal protein S3